MQKVLGIGGIFLKAQDPVALRAWYQTHLGIAIETWGGTAFRWVDAKGEPQAGTTVWSIGSGEYFAPSASSFMVNYRVADTRAFIAQLQAAGCDVVGEVEESEYGVFGWVMDPEGNKIELWQPPAGQ